MNWMNVLAQVFQLVIYPVLSILGVYLVYLITTKIREMKEKSKSELINKYLGMLNTTISDCVLATTQTYVEALKKEGKFDLEAQKIAFTKTYDAVMQILTDDAKKYLTNAVGDLETFVTSKIEADVKLIKLY